MYEDARQWSDQSAFKRDIIVATLRLGGTPDSADEDRPHGLAIKEEVAIMRDEQINHGRLYPNLDGLVRDGLLAKGERDRRTNTYHVTEDGVEAFRQWLGLFAGISPAGDGLPNAPRIEADKQTTVADGGSE